MPIVKKYKAEVISVENPAENIYTAEFKSCNGIFKFLPGQFLHLALEEYDPSAGWPESRCFSMQSSPNQPTLKITWSVKGSFTKRMTEELITGKEIAIKLPFGELFQQEHDKKQSVFIAGGTGITPFLSAFTDTGFSEYINPKLYFGLREKKFHIYSEEFKIAKSINPGLKIIEYFQDKDGMIDILKTLEENGTQSTYFISGPQLMISNFKKELISYEVHPDHIKTDEWE